MTHRKFRRLTPFEQDLLLPRTLLSRIGRGVLPPNTSISKDALLALTKASSVFISHVASEANNLTMKKTISAQDVFEALPSLDWGNLVDRCEAELKVWEEVSRDKRRGYRERVKARESGVSAVSTTADGDGEEEEEEDGERAGKRARVEEIFSTTSASDQPVAAVNGTSETTPAQVLGPSQEDGNETQPEDQADQDQTEDEEGSAGAESSEDEEEEEVRQDVEGQDPADSADDSSS